MDKDKLKNRTISAGQRALTATGIFAIIQEFFSGNLGGISIFATIIFIGLFLLPFSVQKK